MFARPLHVEATLVSIHVAPDVATVSLAQSFTAGSYHDEGQKELVVVRQGGGLRIAREEMITSTVSTAPLGPIFMTVYVHGAVMPVVSAGAQRWVVLQSVPDGEVWSEGPPELVVRDTVVVTRERVRQEEIPPALRALSGQSIVTADQTGASCSARLGALSVLSRVDVHFGVEQRWDGQADDGTQGTPATSAEIAADAWGEGMMLVADLDACPGALVARLASLPPAAFFTPSRTEGALAARALVAFRATPAWRALDDALHESGGTGPWDALEGATPAVTTWTVPGAPRRYVTVVAATSTGGCADFSGALWAAFEVAADGSLTALTRGADPGYHVPVAAYDVDGDGSPEWITESAVVGRTMSGLDTVVDVSPAMHDCYC